MPTRPAGLWPARCSPSPASTAPAAQAGYSTICGAAGSIQFSGAGPIRHVRLPGNTLQIRGQAVCASIKGLPFEPCFNLDKRDERSFRGSVSGMGFAYCDFRHQGAAADADGALRGAAALAACRWNRPASADASRTEVSARVETPPVESARLEPVKSESRAAEPAKAESAPELRRSDRLIRFGSAGR